MSNPLRHPDDAVDHPFCEWLFDLLRFWSAPDGSIRARLYDWSYGEPEW